MNSVVTALGDVVRKPGKHNPGQTSPVRSHSAEIGIVSRTILERMSTSHFVNWMA